MNPDVEMIRTMVANLDPIEDEDSIMRALAIDPHAILYVKDPSEKLQLCAIEHQPFCIKHVDQPTMEMMKLAVGKVGLSIMWIKNPPIKIQELAIESDPYSVTVMRRYISEDLIKKAILKSAVAYRGLINPPDSITKFFIETYPIEAVGMDTSRLSPKMKKFHTKFVVAYRNSVRSEGYASHKV